MKITVLGSGTSTGVPELRCDCRVCNSDNPKDVRMRASVMIESDGESVMIDCGPDFRSQMLDNKDLNPSSVIITHTHYDHVAGLDDIRPFTRGKAVNIYAEETAAQHIIKTNSYMFADKRYPGTPDVKMNIIDLDDFNIGKLKITPIRLMHYKLPVLGYRIGDFAYLTDLSEVDECEFEKLKDLKILFLGVIRHRPHMAHLHLSKGIELINRISPEKTYLTHLCHHIGLHDIIEETLPDNIYLAYDGLKLNM